MLECTYTNLLTYIQSLMPEKFQKNFVKVQCNLFLQQRLYFLTQGWLSSNACNSKRCPALFFAQIGFEFISSQMFHVSPKISICWCGCMLPINLPVAVGWNRNSNLQILILIHFEGGGDWTFWMIANNWYNFTFYIFQMMSRPNANSKLGTTIGSHFLFWQ